MAAPTKRLLAMEAYYIALGKRIREERKYRGLAQIDLAEDLGIAPSTMSGIERGTCRVSAFHLDKICEILRVHIEDIFFEAREARDAVGGA